MSIINFLLEDQKAISALKADNRSEADTYIDLAVEALKNSRSTDPRYEDCLILNTMIRDYWNELPSITIGDLEDECKKLRSLTETGKHISNMSL